MEWTHSANHCCSNYTRKWITQMEKFITQFSILWFWSKQKEDDLFCAKLILFSCLFACFSYKRGHRKARPRTNKQTQFEDTQDGHWERKTTTTKKKKTLRANVETNKESTNFAFIFDAPLVHSLTHTQSQHSLLSTLCVLGAKLGSQHSKEFMKHPKGRKENKKRPEYFNQNVSRRQCRAIGCCYFHWSLWFPNLIAHRKSWSREQAGWRGLKINSIRLSSCSPRAHARLTPALHWDENNVHRPWTI